MKGLSLASRVEVTKKYALAYERAPKRGKTQILDQLVELTGWNRDHARQQLKARLRQAPGRATGTVAVIDRRKTKPRKYSYDALLVLQRVWATTGGMCGKYLAVAMSDVLDAMERSGALTPGENRYSIEVRTELESMSAATIDRYLAPVRAKDPIRGKSTTKPGNLNSITIRKAGEEVAAEPGFFEVDTVAHCGPTTRGEYARSVNFTCIHTGWVFTHTIRNNAHRNILCAFDRFIEAIPFAVSGIDCDNGSEFINHQLIGWAANQQVFFTRSRPYKKNDQATIESKNGHMVRRYGYYHRYDTPTEIKLLNELWQLINDRLNYFTPTKKPTGYTTDHLGRRKRVYDKPKTPYQRLLNARVLNPAQEHELAAHKASLDLTAIAKHIHEIQTELNRLATHKTAHLEQQLAWQPPHPTGIKLHAS